MPSGLGPKLGFIVAGVLLITVSNLIEFGLGALVGIVILAIGVVSGFKYFWNHDG